MPDPSDAYKNLPCRRKFFRRGLLKMLAGTCGLFLVVTGLAAVRGVTQGSAATEAGNGWSPIAWISDTVRLFEGRASAPAAAAKTTSAVKLSPSEDSSSSGSALISSAGSADHSLTDGSQNNAASPTISPVGQVRGLTVSANGTDGRLFPTTNSLQPLPNAITQSWIGGSGDWSVGTNWSPNNWMAGDVAIFNAPAGTVIVGTQEASGLTFNVGGYILTSGTLTLDNGTVITTNGGTTTFDSSLILAGASGISITKTGPGTLVLGNLNSTIGANATWIVQGGAFNSSTGLYSSILALGSGTALGTSTGNILTLDAGTLQFTANGGNGYSSARTINVTANGGTIFDGGFAPGAGTSGGGAISPNITIANGAGLNLVSSNRLQFSTGGVISGAGGINIYGPGTVILPQANSYTGVTNILSGALNIQNATGLGTVAAGTIVTSGAALQLQGGITIGAEALTLNGTGVSNDGALRSISGNNTYGGAITLGSGTRINSDSGLLTLSSGTAISGSGLNLTFGGSGNITVSSVIGTTTGGVTKDGSGTLFLNGVNTFTGGITLSAGTLEIAAGSGLGATPGAGSTQLTFAGNSTLQFSTNVTSGNAINVNRGFLIGTGVTATIDTQGFSVFADNIIASQSAGSGVLNKIGTGTLTLTRGSTYSGGTNVNAGTLQLSSNGALSGVMPIAINAGGSLILDNTGTNNTNRIANTSTLSLNGGNFNFLGNSSAASSEAVGAISGTGNSLFTITAGSSQTATFTAASFSHAQGNGADLINGVGLGSSGSAANRFLLTTAPTLVGTTLATTTGINASVKNTQIVPFLVGEATSSTGGLGTASGVANTFLTYNATTGFRPLNPTDEFDSSTTLTTAGNNVRVTAATTTGTLAINSLILAGGDLSVNDGATLTDTSGALLFTTSNSIKPTGTSGILAFGSAEGMVTVNAGIAGAINTKISGSAGLTKSGTGTLTLGGTVDNSDLGLTVNGGTVVLGKASGTFTHAIGGYNTTELTINSGGTVQLGGSGNDQIYDGGNVVVNTGGIFDLKGFSEGFAALSGTGGSITNSGATDSTLTVGTSADSSTPSSGTYSGVISDGSTNKIALTKIGAATLTLAGTNTYTGATTISAGILQLGNGGTTGSLAASSVITDDGVLVFNRSNIITQGTDFSSAGITGTGSLVQSGSGTVALNAANTYQGGTVINSGILQITADNNLGSGTLTLNGGTLASAQTVGITMTRTIATGTTGGTIQLNNGVPSSGNNKLTLSGTNQITGSGALTLTNNGVLSVGGANTSYSGNWTLNGGVLELTNNQGAGSGSITVNTGAELSTLGSQITNALILNGGRIGWDFFSGSGDYQGPLTLLSSGGIVSLVNFYGAGAINGTISGNISGAGGLSTSSTGPTSTTSGGILTLSGNNSYTGGTNVGTGTTLILGTSTALGATTNSLSVTGTLNLNGHTATVGALTLLDSSVLSFNLGANSADQLFANSAANSGTNYIALNPANFSGTGTYDLIHTNTGSLANTFQFSGAQNLSVPVNSLIVENSNGSFARVTLNNTGTSEQVIVSNNVPANVLTIMPFGSSITAGQSAQNPYNGGGYRSQLYQDLVNDGRFSPAFVGSSTALLSNNPNGGNILSSANQLHHEGHPGWNTQQMLANLNMTNGDPGANDGYWLAPGNGVNPNYITVNIGGNDAVNYGTDSATLLEASHRLDAIVSEFNVLRPGVNTILSSIAYRGDNGGIYGTGIDAYYNPLINGVVFNHVLAGDRVGFLDLRNIINYPTDISPDNIHPTQAGYNKMANAWYQSVIYGAAYWKGGQDSVWSTVNGGSTNWAMDPARTTDRGRNLTDPVTTTFLIYPDVYFNNNSATLNTTLGTDTTVRSLNFTGGATGSVTIGAGNTLTIGSVDSSVTNGNTFTLMNTGGITVQAGSGAHTIAADIILGADQTWGNVSSNALTVSGNVSGAHNLSLVGSYTVYDPDTYTPNGTDYSHATYTTKSRTVMGSGSFLLSGNNTYTGSTTIGTTRVTVDTATSGSTAGLHNTSAITVNAGGTLLLANSGGSSSTDRINNAAPITLAGGILGSANGANEGSAARRISGSVSGSSASGLGALTLNANSTLDFSSSSNGNLFVFSSFTAITGTVLTITNWSNSHFDGINNSGLTTDDRLVFAQDMSGNFNRFDFGSGAGVGVSEILLDGGFYEIGVTPVPEPSTWAAGCLSLTALVWFGCRRGHGARTVVSRGRS